MRSEHDRVEDLLIALTTAHPGLADDLTQVRTYLRALYGRAQQREALAILTRAVEGAAGETDRMRATVQEANALIRRCAAASEEANALAAHALEVTEDSRDRRWGALKGVWDAATRAAGSKPAVATWTLLGVALAYAVAQWLGVADHLPGGHP